MDKTLQMPHIYPVACHTDHIGAGSTFVAIKGQKEDGSKYILKALQYGATTIVVEKDTHLSDDVLDALAHVRAKLLYVENARQALAQLSAQAVGYPAQKLRIVGITGTKGKTTSSFLLEHVLRSAGHKTALLSTVKNKILDVEFKTNLTTQHPDYLHNFFSLCVETGVEIVVMEVAAQAHSLHRVDGLAFDGFIFTNFDKEHAEFYPTMDEYFAAKVALLNQVKKDAPILLNGDDVRVGALDETFVHAKLFGIHKKDVCSNKDADYRGEILGNNLEKLELEVSFPSTQENKFTLSCPSLVGSYNAYNILGVTSLCLELCISAHKISDALLSFTAVPGRLERYDLPNGARCFIDYAHNPSSFQAVLGMMRSLTNHLIVLFGAGGARDKTKRPMMGNIATDIADLVILTSDNPRTEDPAQILQDILAGVSDDKKNKVICELDREQAIKKAYEISKSGSVIMLLGKGPDEYQIVGEMKHPFSEKKIVQNL